LCQYGCQQLSSLKPKLDTNGVRLVAIGMEDGLEDFVSSHFFKSDLFVDKRLSTYKVLELPSFAARPPPAAAGGETAVGGGADNAAARLFTLAGKVPSHVRFGLDVNAQLGGTYVVQVGGRVVMEHLQAEPGDYLKHDDILRALGIAKEPAA